ncbi:hypothetical protein YC2023_073062 [Brassica napus]
MKRDVVIIVIIFILVLIILSRSSSIQAAGSFITTKIKHSLSVARVKNHHEFVITEMSTFNKFRGRSSKFRRKIDGNEDEEEKRIIPAGPNPLHNRLIRNYIKEYKDNMLNLIHIYFTK